MDSFSSPPPKDEQPQPPAVLIQTYYDEKDVLKERIWERGSLLGKGGFSRVYELVRQDTTQTFAGKLIPRKALQTSYRRKRLENEIQLHRHLGMPEPRQRASLKCLCFFLTTFLDHPHIVKLVHYFAEEDYHVLVTELCPDGTL